MTWIIGASSLFGNGVVISDIQVTFSNGKTRDILQKAYPLGNFIVGGFAGSVLIGFNLLESMRQFLALPEDIAQKHAWNPTIVAQNWSPIAKQIYDASPEQEKKLGSQFLIVGISPQEHTGVPSIARVFIIRFSWPDFKPGIMNKPLSVCSIGSGAGVDKYKKALKGFFDIRSSSIQFEGHGFGVWAEMISHSLGTVIRDNPKKGISKHHNIFVFNRSQLIETNNDETIYPPDDAEPIEIKMPDIAKSYEEFIRMTQSRGYRSECAIC
ncbi:MAG: hypothetical protein HUJ29_00765 [Gammaproteobacteria bacterium]|nr:hypothetical protein [Gammaproteobacteria bacterium]